MSANSVKNRQRIAPSMMFFTLFAGITGFVYQFMLDGSILTFMVTTAAIGGLVGTSKDFDERDRQLLWQSYAKAFEYLFVAIYIAYSLIVLANWLHIGTGIIGFINEHWLSILVSAMCILLGGIGLRNFHEAD
jgi:hypothetical protein